MDIRILGLLLACATLAVCKHTGHKDNSKHQKGRKDLVREFLELRGKHNGNNKHKNSKHHEESSLKRLLEKATESDAELIERSAYETNDEDERSEYDSSEGESDRSEGESDRSEGESDISEDESDRSEGESGRSEGETDRSEGESDRSDEESVRGEEESDRSETDELDLLSALADRFF